MSVLEEIFRLSWTSLAGICWPVLLFYYFCRSRTDGKYRRNYAARMGLSLPDSLPETEGGPLRRPRVWIHALSVGETISSVPLVMELRQRDPELEILFSTATETGMALAEGRLAGLVDSFFFMPHDFPWAIKNILRRLKPSLFVLIETDFWPNLLFQLRRERVPAVLVNGRLSPGSSRKYSRLARIASMIFRRFDFIFSQTEEDRKRFVGLGGCPGRVIAAGNLKFEASMLGRVTESEVESMRCELGLEPGRPVLVAGSTHEGEEAILLRIHRDLLVQIPDLLLIVAPRNPHRRLELEALCKSSDLGAGIRSKGESAAGRSVFLLDTLGELSKAYGLCRIAFIGGSLVPLGGHNPLEAVAQGKPVCWGPSFFNFSEIEKSLLDAGCGARLNSERDLLEFLSRILKGTELANMARSAEHFADSRRGTAKKIGSVLLGILQEVSYGEKKE